MVTPNPYARPIIFISPVDNPTQTNILIDHDFRPRLTDYGIGWQIRSLSISSLPVNHVRYLAPEVLNPSAFGLKNGIATKKSDIYAFGVLMYEVSTTSRASVTATKGTNR